MKVFAKHAMFLVFIANWVMLQAQTQTENHIVTKTYKVKTQSSLTTSDVNKVTTAIKYFDELGRPKQSVIVQGGAGSYSNNALAYDWSVGTPTNSGFYNLNGGSAGNQIVNGTTPFGDTDLLWECISITTGQSSDPDGGWNTDYMSVDETKAYRYTVWVKKTGDLADGVTYHGTQFVDNLDGTYNSGPYFWFGDLPQLDTWYLMVGYIHPTGYTGGDLGISGVYDINGNKVLDGTEFKWSVHNTSDKRFRNYLWGATQAATRQYFWSPVVQKIDGNEDSLDDIITSTSVFDNQDIVAKDIVTGYEYDGFGRQAKQYLSYASSNTDGRFEASAKEDTQSYYLNRYGVDFPGITNPADINAFSEQVFENNALQRPTEQTAPGLSWKQGDSLIVNQEYSNGHTIKFNYELNAANEVKYLPVTTTVSGDTRIPSLGFQSYYGANELTKTITKDENWSVTDGLNRTTEEFKDKNGQVVLKRTYNNSQAHDTYYIYDDFGNLTYVLPPKAADQTITQTVLNELCYQYVYDYRNRLVEKKIPGKGWEYIVYNKLDQPVLTQDALQRETGKWLFTKYDALQRVAYTGQYTTTDSRTDLQNTVNGQSAMNLYEDTITLTASVLGGEDVYYTNRSFPNATSVEVFTINYYDEYLHLPSGLTVPTEVYDREVTTNTQSLATVSKVRVLTTNDWITTVSYYDQKARPIYVYSQNDYLQTTDIIESQLDFTGKVLETKTTHSKVGIAEDIVTVDRFEYDHMDRLISQSQKVNDHISERIVRNNYDDLGQLKSKLTGNGTAKGYTDITSGISVSGGEITKTGAAGWNEGLGTLGSFQGNGYVEFQPVTNSEYLMAGLSSNNDNASYVSIDYAIFLVGTEIRIYESGAPKGIVGTYDAGDVFRVERINNKIYYKHKGETIYISSVLSSGTLMGDISINGTGDKIKNLHIVDNSKGLQNVDYAYNVRGWLKSINDDTQNDNDLFNFSLKYNDPTGNTAALYNANISETHWDSASSNTTSNPVSNSYSYSYDALNRIISGIDNTGNYNLSSVSYDKMGNILTLQRTGHTNAAATLFGMMDNLSYTYDSGNKLLQVDDASGKTEGFKNASGVDYTYDINGNMISDGNKGISSITYNHLNLPVTVSFASQQASINYVYDATGGKQEKTVSGVSISATTTEYAGNYIYEKVSTGNTELQFFNHSEGYTKQESGGFEYIYQYKDHLGNVRLTYSDGNSNGIIEIAANTGGNYTEIIEESNYYPFGLKHKGYNDVVSANGNSLAQRYKFGGKEYNEELGLNWYDISARNYDPALGRWMNIDPLAEKMRRHSPYNYAFNNPIFWIDSDGMAPTPAKDDCCGGLFRILERMLSTTPVAREVIDRGEIKVSAGNTFGLEVKGIGIEVDFGSKEIGTYSLSGEWKDGDPDKETSGFSIKYGLGQAGITKETKVKKVEEKGIVNIDGFEFEKSIITETTETKRTGSITFGESFLKLGLEKSSTEKEVKTYDSMSHTTYSTNSMEKDTKIIIPGTELGGAKKEAKSKLTDNTLLSFSLFIKIEFNWKDKKEK